MDSSFPLYQCDTLYLVGFRLNISSESGSGSQSALKDRAFVLDTSRKDGWSQDSSLGSTASH